MPGVRRMTWLKLASIAMMALGAWTSFKAMGVPVRHGGRLYYRQPDGRYRRWYGGRSFGADELGL